MKAKMIIRCVFKSMICIMTIATFSCRPVAQNHEVIPVKVKNTVNDPIWLEYYAKTVDNLFGFKRQTEPPLSKYGGWKVNKYKATGFFRTEKIDGRWWIIDPEGYPYIDRSVVSVRMGGSDRQVETVNKKFGNSQKWFEETAKLIKKNGFSSAGCWSDVGLIRNSEEKLVYTVNVSPMQRFRSVHRERAGGVYKNAGWQGFENDLVLVFDPEFEEYVEDAVKEFGQYKDDPYLLGYFTDNELPWKNDALIRHLIYLDHSDPGYIAAKKWLDERKGKDATLVDIRSEDISEFNAYYFDKYMSVITKAIKKYDPNHMYLGCRFNQETEELRNRAIFEVAGKYMDIVSINHYRKWEPDQRILAQWEQWSGKPFMITEWYTKAEDSGLANKTGAGWLVKIQRDRGYFYQNFCIELLKSSGCVGWHWFKYQDNDPTDLSTDPSNRDSNKGIVDALYEPYDDFLEEMRTLNTQTYHLIRYFENNQLKK